MKLKTLSDVVYRGPPCIFEFSNKTFFFGNFLKMVNGGTGPGQATGTVFRPKIESQHIEFIFSKIIIF